MVWTRSQVQAIAKLRDPKPRLEGLTFVKYGTVPSIEKQCIEHNQSYFNHSKKLCRLERGLESRVVVGPRLDASVD
jgi:hypothetical protein